MAMLDDRKQTLHFERSQMALYISGLISHCYQNEQCRVVEWFNYKEHVITNFKF